MPIAWSMEGECTECGEPITPDPAESLREPDGTCWRCWSELYPEPCEHCGGKVWAGGAAESMLDGRVWCEDCFAHVEGYPLVVEGTGFDSWVESQATTPEAYAIVTKLLEEGWHGRAIDAIAAAELTARR